MDEGKPLPILQIMGLQYSTLTVKPRANGGKHAIITKQTFIFDQDIKYYDYAMSKWYFKGPKMIIGSPCIMTFKAALIRDYIIFLFH